MGLGDLMRLLPNRVPSSEEELGRDWPLWRDGQSRLEGGLLRMWGLLMMEPCNREEGHLTGNENIRGPQGNTLVSPKELDI